MSFNWVESAHPSTLSYFILSPKSHKISLRFSKHSRDKANLKYWQFWGQLSMFHMHLLQLKDGQGVLLKLNFKKTETEQVSHILLLTYFSVSATFNCMITPFYYFQWGSFWEYISILFKITNLLYSYLINTNSETNFLTNVFL